MSRIYIVTDRETQVDRYVRAKTLNSAIRAVADERYTGASATTEQMYQAFKLGFEVLDAVDDGEAESTQPEQDAPAEPENAPPAPKKGAKK